MNQTSPDHPARKGLIRVHNETDEEVRLVVELRGDKHPIPPGGHVIVKYAGPIDGNLEVGVGPPGRIVVYEWPGSVLEVVHVGGERCDEHLQDGLPYLPAPPLPGWDSLAGGPVARDNEEDLTMSGQVRVYNETGGVVRLVLEPWADEYSMPPEGSLIVTYVGPIGSDLEMGVGPPGRIVLYGWPGSSMEVYHVDGRRTRPYKLDGPPRPPARPLPRRSRPSG